MAMTSFQALGELFESMALRLLLFLKAHPLLSVGLNLGGFRPKSLRVWGRRRGFGLTAGV